MTTIQIALADEKVCSHQWRDVRYLKNFLVFRVDVSPIIGQSPKMMEPGQTYKCIRCGLLNHIPVVIHAYCDVGDCENAETGTVEDLKAGHWTFSEDLETQWCYDHEI